MPAQSSQRSPTAGFRLPGNRDDGGVRPPLAHRVVPWTDPGSPAGFQPAAGEDWDCSMAMKTKVERLRPSARTRTTRPRSVVRRSPLLDRSPPANGAPDLRPARTTRSRDGKGPAVHRGGSREPPVHAQHRQNPLALVIAQRPHRGDAQGRHRVRPSPGAPTRDALLLVPARHQLGRLLPLYALRMDQMRVREPASRHAGGLHTTDRGDRQSRRANHRDHAQRMGA